MIKFNLVVLFTISQISVGFKYYLVVFLTFTLISVGILLLKNPFFLFANATADFLNSILEHGKERSHKHRILLDSLGKLLPRFGLLLFFLAMTIGVSFIPVVVYLEYNPRGSVQDLDMRSIYFFISVILGCFALFIVPWANRNKESDSSGWSMLLHRMILENYNISSALFHFEKKLFKKQINSPTKDFVIVSGLARGGSSALTNLLLESNRFHSLSYDNMPFLMAVNLWRNLHRPRRIKSKRSTADDSIMYGYKTIAVLEEYYFKVFLKDGFVSGSTLEEHEVDKHIYENYVSYQKLIGRKNSENIYLAKNSNLILRYRSLRNHNPDFKILIVFRNPLAHSFSLLTQHNRFCDMQEADPFSLEYMNWLGHYEFGLNHKLFNLEQMDLCRSYEDSSINYWIAIWISYYTHILSLLEDENLFLIDYFDLCSKPKELLSTLGGILKLQLSQDQKEPYTERELSDLDPDEELLARAQSLHENLRKHKVEIR